MQNPVKQSVILTEPAANIPAPAQADAEKAPRLGICALCSNQETCVFPRSQTAVMNCDELDYPGGEYCLPVPRTKSEVKLASASDCQTDSRAGSGGFLGLCSTCDIREKCVFPKPEGGVWHCEEFV